MTWCKTLVTIKISPFFLLSCISPRLNCLVGGILFLAKFADGNGGGVGSVFVVRLASMVIGLLFAYLVSNRFQTIGKDQWRL